MYKKLFSLIIFFSLIFSAFSADIVKTTHTFAEREGVPLQLDIYKNKLDATTQPVLLFVFGGGFKEGTRDQESYLDYYRYFAENGFTVVAIDYRLGLKDEKAPGIFNQKPLRRAIGLAVEDLYTATDYLIKNADELLIDISKIIISGSSAGAITVLHADYEHRNGMSSDTILSDGFQYAGVISFAGAIFSREGLPDYAKAPAPTLFFHGSADKLVPYRQISFLNLGMFGSKPLAKRFKAKNYPYLFYSMENIGHDVAVYPIEKFQPEVFRFIQDYVFDKKPLMMDINYFDPNQESKYNRSAKYYYNLD